MEENWNFKSKAPPIKGWYAIAYMWDAREGTFFGADYYDNGWLGTYPVTAFHGTFDTEEEAKEYAKENDWEI